MTNGLAPKGCCWHTYQVLTSNPPQQKQRCCWCQSERIMSVGPSEHGPYVPLNKG
jgi:hypothetical protein